MKKIILPVLAAAAFLVAGFLIVSQTMGNDSLPDCSISQEITVSEDRPNGVDSQKCKDPVTGDVMWETLEGNITYEGDTQPPTITPNPEEGAR